MQIDYFADNLSERTDKSDWFASITSISGCLNGTTGPHALGLDQKTCLPSTTLAKGLLLPLLYGYSVLHNLVQGPLTGQKPGAKSMSEPMEVEVRKIYSGLDV